MHIVFAASECAPWAKTGGLADVISALPKMLVKMGHKVQVFIPYYRQVAKAISNPPMVLESVTIPFPSYNRFVRILDGGSVDGVQMYFVDSPELFDRESFYATPS
ncbi:MAG TPA: glycogen/starch synthase, partial [Edaphobacter sp.]|nr:glycogen/starch synthase [Edaphobacter sp.]